MKHFLLAVLILLAPGAVVAQTITATATSNNGDRDPATPGLQVHEGDTISLIWIATPTIGSHQSIFVGTASQSADISGEKLAAGQCYPIPDPLGAIVFTIHDDTDAEGDETIGTSVVILYDNAAPNCGGNEFHNMPVNIVEATITILANDGGSQANIGGADATVRENGSVNVPITFTGAPRTAASTVTFSITGSAGAADYTVDDSGSDITFNAASATGAIVIDHTASSGSIPIAITADLDDDGGETIIVTLTGHTGGGSGVTGFVSAAARTYTLAEAERPVLLLTGPTMLSETDADFTTTYTIVRAGQELVTSATIGWEIDTAEVSAADFAAISGTVSFAAGDDMQTFTVTVKGDVLSEGTERFSIRLTSPPGTDFIFGSPHRVTLIDDDNAVFTINAPAGATAEGARPAFTVTYNAKTALATLATLSTRVLNNLPPDAPANEARATDLDWDDDETIAANLRLTDNQIAAQFTITVPVGTAPGTVLDLGLPVIVDDDLAEGREHYQVVVGFSGIMPPGGEIADNSPYGVIAASDPIPVSVAAPTQTLVVTEGDTGADRVRVNFTLPTDDPWERPAAETSIRITYTVDNTAMESADIAWADVRANGYAEFSLSLAGDDATPALHRVHNAVLVTGVTGFNFNAVVADHTPFGVTVLDDDPQSWVVLAVDPGGAPSSDVQENAPAHTSPLTAGNAADSYFRVLVWTGFALNPAVRARTVLTYCIYGTARGGLATDLSRDFTWPDGYDPTADVSSVKPECTAGSGTLTFAAGAGPQYRVPLFLHDDALVEGDETIFIDTVSAVSDEGYTNGVEHPYYVGDNSRATRTIKDNDTITAGIAVTAPDDADSVAAGHQVREAVHAVFTVTLSGALTTTAAIPYAISGDVEAADYIDRGEGLVTLAAGSASADIRITILADADTGATETLTVTLLGLTSQSASVQIIPDALLFTARTEDLAVVRIDFPVAVGGTAATREWRVDDRDSGGSNSLPRGIVEQGDCVSNTSIALTNASRIFLCLGSDLASGASYPTVSYVPLSSNSLRLNGAVLDSEWVVVAADGLVPTWAESPVFDTFGTQVTFVYDEPLADLPDGFRATITPSLGVLSPSLSADRTVVTVALGQRTVSGTEYNLQALARDRANPANESTASVAVVFTDTVIMSITGPTMLSETDADFTDTWTIVRTGEELDASVAIGWEIDTTEVSAADFTAVSGMVNFAAGDDMKTFTLTVKGDNLHEGDERFGIRLTSPPGTGSIISSAHRVTLIDDDDNATFILTAPVGYTAEGDRPAFTVTYIANDAAQTALASSVTLSTRMSSSLPPDVLANEWGATDLDWENDHTLDANQRMMADQVTARVRQIIPVGTAHGTVIDLDLPRVVDDDLTEGREHYQVLIGYGGMEPAFGANIVDNFPYRIIAASDPIPVSVAVPTQTLVVTEGDTGADRVRVNFALPASDPWERPTAETNIRITYTVDNTAMESADIAWADVRANGYAEFSLSLADNDDAAPDLHRMFNAVRVTGATGFNFSAVVADHTPFGVTVLDNDPQSWVVLAIDAGGLPSADVQEDAPAHTTPLTAGNATDSYFRVLVWTGNALNRPVRARTVLTYCIYGTARGGLATDLSRDFTWPDDYDPTADVSSMNSNCTAGSGTLTFAAGAGSQYRVPLFLHDDALAEGDETILIDTVSAVSDDGYTNVVEHEFYVGVNSRATRTIKDNDTTTAGIAATAPADADLVAAGHQVREGVHAMFTVTLSGALMTTAAIPYAVSGDVEAADYIDRGNGLVTMAAGSTSADIRITILADADTGATETLTVTLLGLTSQSASMQIIPDVLLFTARTEDLAVLQIDFRAAVSGTVRPGEWSVVDSDPGGSNRSVRGIVEQGACVSNASATLTSATRILLCLDSNLASPGSFPTVTYTAPSSNGLTLNGSAITGAHSVVAADGLIPGWAESPVFNTLGTQVTFVYDEPLADLPGGFRATITPSAGVLSPSLSADRTEVTVDLGQRAVSGTEYNLQTLARDRANPANENTESERSVFTYGAGTSTIAITAGATAITEPPNNAAAVAYTMTRSGPEVAAAVVATWEIIHADGGTSDADFVATGGTVRFAAGESTKNFSILVAADALSENEEGFTVNVSAPFHNAGAARAAAIAANGPNEAFLTGAVDIASEGATLNVEIAFRGERRAFTTLVGFDISGTAQAGTDYTVTTNTGFPSLAFDPATGRGSVQSRGSGIASAIIPIRILGDSVREGPETLIVTLNDTVHPAVDSTSRTYTIEDPTQAFIRGADMEVEEGSDLLVRIGFRGFPRGRFTTHVGFDISGTAQAGTDYAVTTNTGFPLLAFDPVSGTGTVQTGGGFGAEAIIRIRILDDLDQEEAETLIITLNETAFRVADSTPRTYTITTDHVEFTVTGGDTVSEADTDVTARYTITRSGARLTAPTTVSWAVRHADTNGTSAADFIGATSGQVNFAAGDDRKTFTLTIAGDRAVEGNERFSIRLGTEAGSDFIAGSDLPVTIWDDDDDNFFALSARDPSVAEGNAPRFIVTYLAGDESRALPATSVLTVTVTSQHGGLGPYEQAASYADWSGGVNNPAVWTGAVTVPANTAHNGRVEFDLPVVVDDGLNERREQYRVFIRGGGGRFVPPHVHHFIAASDPIGVSVTATHTFNEGDDAGADFAIRFHIPDGVTWDGDNTIAIQYRRTGHSSFPAAPEMLGNFNWADIVAAGSATFDFSAPGGDDTTAEPHSVYSFTVLGVNAPNFNADLGGNTAITLTELDDDPRAWVMTARDGGQPSADLAESASPIASPTTNGSDAESYFRLIGTNSNAGVRAETVLTYCLYGSARGGLATDFSRDYTWPAGYDPAADVSSMHGDCVNGSGVVTLAAGDSNIYRVGIPLNDDSLVENDETIHARIVTATLAGNYLIEIGNPFFNIQRGTDFATRTIKDDDTITAGIAATAPADADSVAAGHQVREGVHAVFTVSLSGALMTTAAIPYAIGGDVEAADYIDRSGGLVTIAQGSTSADIRITILADADTGATETLTVTLLSLTSQSASVQIIPDALLFTARTEEPAVVRIDFRAAVSGTVRPGEWSVVDSDSGASNRSVRGIVEQGACVSNASAALTSATRILLCLGSDLASAASYPTVAYTAPSSNGLTLNGSAITGEHSVVAADGQNPTWAESPVFDTFGTQVTFVYDEPLADLPGGFRATITPSAGVLSPSLSADRTVVTVALGQRAVSGTEYNLQALARDRANPLNENTETGRVVFTYGVASSTIAITDGATAAIELSDSANAHLYTITRSGPEVALAAVATWEIIHADGGTSDADFDTTGGTVRFAAGESTKNFSILVAADALSENDEDFTVNVSAPFHNAGTPWAATIYANGPNEAFLAGADTAPEGATLNVEIAFRGMPRGFTTFVGFDISGTAQAGIDYAVTTNTGFPRLIFDPATGRGNVQSGGGGRASAIIPIRILGDSVREGPETLIVTLNDTLHNDVDSTPRTYTIQDPTEAFIRGADREVTEGSDLEVRIGFRGFPRSRFTTSVGFDISGTAQAGTDYTVATSTGFPRLAFDSAGGTGTVQTSGGGGADAVIRIRILADQDREEPETLIITLNETEFRVADSTPRTYTIRNVDARTLTLTRYADSARTIPTADTSLTETDADQALYYRIGLESGDQAFSAATVVTWAIGHVTTTATDVTATTGSVIMAASASAVADFVITLTGDNLNEASEQFTVTLGLADAAADGGTIIAAGDMLTIVDDDGIELTHTTVGDGTEGTTATVIFNLGAVPTTDLMLDYAITFPTGAGAGVADITGATTGSVAISAAASTPAVVVAIGIVDDPLNEGEESFTVVSDAGQGDISGHFGSAAGRAEAVVLIPVNDLITLSARATTDTVVQGTTATFTVTLSNAADRAVVAPWRVNELNGPAVIATATGTLTFAAATPNLSQTVAAPVALGIRPGLGSPDMLIFAIGNVTGHHGALTGGDATVQVRVERGGLPVRIRLFLEGAVIP